MERDHLMTTNRPAIETYLMDMDGVLVHEERLIPGADLFVKRLQQTGHRFLLLTNNSIYTPRDLAARLALTGLEVPEEAIWTSALATARFLDTQRPQGSAYVLGEAGLTTALHQVGYVLTEREPDYVVIGETRAYSQQAITRAIRLIAAGARFIATNPDPTGPSPAGPQPATGAVAALVSKATGVRPYFVGKPNPLMMREALRAIDAHSESTAMIGWTPTWSPGSRPASRPSWSCRASPPARRPSGSRSCPRGSWPRWPTWSTRCPIRDAARARTGWCRRSPGPGGPSRRWPGGRPARPGR
jgi:NagD protein